MENYIIKLYREAEKAAAGAYAPYSGFSVGAALLSEDGRVFTGCNIENASYSVTICAERVALFSAVAAGARRFSAIAVAGGRMGNLAAPCPPCGVCRQALSEFCGGDMLVILSDGGGGVRSYRLGELLPESFGPSVTEKGI